MISGSCPPWSFLTNPDWCRQCGCWFVVWSHPWLLPWEFSATWLTIFLLPVWTNVGFRWNSRGILNRVASFWSEIWWPFWHPLGGGISCSLASLRNEIWRPFDTMSVGKFAGNFESCGFLLERDLAAFWHYVGGEIRGKFRVLWLPFGARFGGLLTLCRWGNSRGISSLVTSFWSEIWLLTPCRWGNSRGISCSLAYFWAIFWRPFWHRLDGDGCDWWRRCFVDISTFPGWICVLVWSVVFLLTDGSSRTLVPVFEGGSRWCSRRCQVLKVWVEFELYLLSVDSSLLMNAVMRCCRPGSCRLTLYRRWCRDVLRRPLGLFSFSSNCA